MAVVCSPPEPQWPPAGRPKIRSLVGPPLLLPVDTLKEDLEHNQLVMLLLLLSLFEASWGLLEHNELMWRADLNLTSRSNKLDLSGLPVLLRSARRGPNQGGRNRGAI